MGSQPSAQARLWRCKGGWDSWFITVGLRLRLGRVKGTDCRILFLLSFPLPGISFLNSSVCWALPMALLKLSTNIYSSCLTSSQTASVVVETELQPPEGSDCKFTAWSIRESTGKRMLFLGGTCHLLRVVPSGVERFRPPVRERGRSCRRREREGEWREMRGHVLNFHFDTAGTGAENLNIFLFYLSVLIILLCEINRHTTG